MQSYEDLILAEVRARTKTLARRTTLDRYFRFIRTCAVCTACLPPIDFLCDRCWTELGAVMNRGESLKQANFVFPTYSLLTWTPKTERFVRPLIYGFKGGHSPAAAERLATLFLSERREADCGATFVTPPARRFDHGQLWASTLAGLSKAELHSPFRDLSAKGQQKELRQGERGARRYEIREHFANWVETIRGAKRIVFADDVITSGSTAMAAYMALGDPERFEVWTLVARPRLATKRGSC